MTCCLSASPFRLNHSSKSSEELKTSGRRKLSSDHNSCRLFCHSDVLSNIQVHTLKRRLKQAIREREKDKEKDIREPGREDKQREDQESDR